MSCHKSANGRFESISIQPLYNALSHRLIPWAEQWDSKRIIVPPHTFAELARQELPLGTQASGRKLCGIRNTLRIVHQYDYTMPTEHWPVDGIEITPFPIMVCVLNGSAQLEMGDYLLQCEEGTFVIVPPRVAHPDGINPHLKDWQSGNGSCDLFWIYYWKGGVICHLCHSRGSQHIPPQSHEECYAQSRQALACFDVMTEEMARPQSVDPRVIKGSLLTLLSILRREIEDGNYVQPGVAVVESPPPTEQDPILRAAHYIQSHLNEPLTIDRMACRCYMSRTKFVRRFRDRLGVSFVSYVNDQRLSKVKSLLRDTDWSLETICNLSGLKPSNLRILMRHHTGMSPLEYRRHSREIGIDRSELANEAGALTLLA